MSTRALAVDARVGKQQRKDRMVVRTERRVDRAEPEELERVMLPVSVRRWLSSDFDWADFLF
jgi:hypothetical protein